VEEQNRKVNFICKAITGSELSKMTSFPFVEHKQLESLFSPEYEQGHLKELIPSSLLEGIDLSWRGDASLDEILKMPLGSFDATPYMEGNNVDNHQGAWQYYMAIPQAFEATPVGGSEVRQYDDVTADVAQILEGAAPGDAFESTTVASAMRQGVDVAQILQDTAPGVQPPRFIMSQDYAVVAPQVTPGIDHLSNSVVYHHHPADPSPLYPTSNVATIPHQQDAFDMDPVIVPRPMDVCFGLLDYPGTNHWRAILQDLSDHRPCWSTDVYDEMKRRLEPGCRFLICRNSVWYMASEREIRLKSNQRFRDGRK
jgi:hypothetical protein